METENDLLNLLLKSPNSESIPNIAEQLENDHNFSFSKDRNDLKGVWELRWSSSNSPFLKYSPFIDNLQILDPLNLMDQEFEGYQLKANILKKDY